MKIPCEVVVWYLLPTIRREVAKELVANYGFTQSRVAKRFGVTDAAISQYLKNKRGDYDVVINNPGFPLVQEEIASAAYRMANRDSDFSEEICSICLAAKRCGILAKIYEVEFGCSYPECECENHLVIAPE